MNSQNSYLLYVKMYFHHFSIISIRIVNQLVSLMIVAAIRSLFVLMIMVITKKIEIIVINIPMEMIRKFMTI